MTHQDDPLTIAEEAIRWHLRHQNGLTQGEHGAFEHWLQTPAHRAEYDDLQQLWQDVAQIPVSAVASLRPAPTRRPRWRALAWSCGLMLCAVVLFFPLRNEFAAPRYTASWQTKRGQMRQIGLPDGSQVSLDAGTQLRVR